MNDNPFDRRGRYGDAHLSPILIWSATLVFMASYFITKGPYNLESNLINLTYLEVGVMTVLLAIRQYLLRDGVLVNSALIAIPVFLLLASHVLLVNHGSEAAYLTKLVRLFVYLLIVILFVRCFFQWHVFLTGLYWFSWASAGLALFTATMAPHYFTDMSYGFPRARALLSEPSAFGPIIPMLFYMSLVKKNLLGACLAIATAYVVASDTVYFVLVLAGVPILIWLLSKSEHRMKYAIAVSVALLAAFLAREQIHGLMSGEFNYDRALGQIQAVGEFGGKTRLAPLFTYYLLFKEEGGLWFGKGLNGMKVFFADVPEENLRYVSEFSLLHAFFFSFGFAGIAVLAVLILYVFIVLWRRGSIEMLIVYSCFLFASLLNSSGGHVLYKYVYVFMILAVQWTWTHRYQARVQHSFPNRTGCPQSRAAPICAREEVKEPLGVTRHVF